MLGYVVVKFTEEGILKESMSRGNTWIYEVQDGEDTKFYFFTVPDGLVPEVGDFLIDGNFNKGANEA